jgi:DNA-binding beta-propeller fold protein YncE
MTGFNPPAATKHSVRGILFVDGTLYVADEGGARVALYDAGTGAFSGSLTATSDGKYTFATPVGLALDPTTGHVYIGDPGNDAIFSYHPSSKKLDVVVDKKSGGSAVEKVSGLAVDSDGTLYFASRKAQAISTYANGKVTTFVSGLTDTPECLLLVAV